MLLGDDLGKDRGHSYCKSQKVADGMWDYSGLGYDKFTLWKFIEVYIYDVSTFLKVWYIFKVLKFLFI